MVNKPDYEIIEHYYRFIEIIEIVLQTYHKYKERPRIKDYFYPEQIEFNKNRKIDDYI